MPKIFSWNFLAALRVINLLAFSGSSWNSKRTTISVSISSVNSYSKALYELAQENKSLNQIEEQIEPATSIDDNQNISNPTIQTKEQIVSQIQLDIPTYTKDNLPKSLSLIEAVKPGSRNL